MMSSLYLAYFYFTILHPMLPFIKKLMTPEEIRFRKNILAWVIVFTSFLVTSQIGVFLYRDIGTSPAIIWPPIGIALAAVVIEGSWIWSAIALAALGNGLLRELPLFLVACAMVSNTVQPLVGGYVLRRFRFDPMLSTMKDMFAIIGVALISTMIVPTASVSANVLYNHLFSASRPLPSWVAVWIGGALSAMVLTPLLVRWWKPITARTRALWVEVAISLTLLIGISYFLFATTYVTFAGISLALFLVGVLFWMAFRLGPRFMTLSLFLMTTISLAGAIYGTHPPSATSPTLSDRLFNTEVFDLLLAFFFFVLVSVEEQRKEAVKALRQEAEQLERALEKIRVEESAKNNFIATLAHELRNPLAPLRSSIDVLKLIGASTPEKTSIFATMDNQIHTIARLLDDLLDITRITRNKMTLRLQTIPLQNALERGIESARPYAAGKSHQLHVTLPDGGTYVSVDPVRFEQIVVNILHNAAKYTPERGDIYISAEKDGNTAVIRIKDTGIGILKDMLDHVFEPFVQANPEESGGGLGIGLALTKNLVSMHGGTISAYSSGAGGGSEFTIVLPLAPPPQSQSTSTAHSITDKKTIVKNVLR